MRTSLLLSAALLVTLAVPVSADSRSEAKSQVAFGINVAEKGLWREAAIHWEQATKLDPNYAEAWNNLGVAYEQQGRFEDALKAYKKAMELQPGNQMVRQNYDLFREIYDRAKRRNGG
jgi:Flp pilus assembly protein TadD